MRRLLLHVAVPALVALGAVGCGASEDSASDGQASSSKKGAPSGDPIIIGHSAGVTGFMKPYDWVPSKAAEIAVEDINAKGGVLGRPLKLIVADAKSDKVQSGTAAAELLGKGAEFILAPCDFDLGAAAAIEAQKQSKIAISPCAGSVQFGVQGIGPYAYTLGNLSAGYSTQMAEWAHEKKGWRTTYILQDDAADYSKQSCRSFEAAFKKLPDAKVLGVDHFLGSDASINAQITRLRQQDPAPDFIFTCSSAISNVVALRGLVSAGLSPKIPLVGAGQQWDGDYWKKSVPKASNLYWPTIGLVDGKDPRPEINDLAAKLGPELGDLLSPWIVYGYSAVQAIAMAVEKAGSTDSEAVKKALDSFSDEKLMVGPTTFTPELHMTVDRPGAILQVQKGKTSFVEFWEPKAIPDESEWVGG